MRRSAFCRRLAEATVSVECRPLSPEALVNWVIQKAGRAGKQWSTEAVQALLDRSGSDLGAVNTEMEKVSILVGERDGIGIEDVRGAFGLSRYSPYALGSAVWAGNLKESLTILSDLLEWGESPGTILYALTRDLLSLLKVRALLDRKVPQQEIVAALCRSRLPIQAARALLEAARERTARELGRNLESVYRVDRAVKSGREESEASLQGLVFALCHRSRACGQPERKRRSQDE
jgi:DNA polymerase-3 subunit delta